MPTVQFNDKQKRISSRLDRFENISKLLSSTKKADRQQAQRKLKALGRYNGPIDGAQGKGTTAALKAMRNKIDADQIRLDKNINNFNKVEAGKRKSEAKKRADKAAENKRKDGNATKQGLFNVGALAVSSAVVKVQINALNKQDAPAVAAKNKELARFTKEIDQIKSEPGAKTKAKNLKAVTKRRIGAVAEQATKSGVTKYRGPIGAPGGALMFAKGAFLQYAASKTDNELLKGTLEATGNGLMFAGAATPLFRTTGNAFGKNQLNGQHLAKIADAKALAAPKTKTAPKSKARSVLSKSLKVVGKGTSKAVPVLGWGLAAYAIGEAAYSKFSKTGSVAKAATAGTEAGVDVLTSGGYSVTKKQAKSFYKQSPNVLVNKGVSGYAKYYAPHNVVLRTALSFIPAKYLPANGKKVLNDAKAAVKTPTRKVKSVGALLKSSTAKTKAPVLKSSFRKASTTKAKRAGAKIKVVRGGKTFYRKNPHYGK
jgi:hypothetical protein